MTPIEAFQLSRELGLSTETRYAIQLTRRNNGEQAYSRKLDTMETEVYNEQKHEMEMLKREWQTARRWNS